jgi:hypothetical protein
LPSLAAITKTHFTASPDTQKELLIESGDCKCIVKVGPRDTLTDARALLHKEFDYNVLPTYTTFSSMVNAGDANGAAFTARDAFHFCLAGVRLHRMRETRTRAWDWVGPAVRIIAKLPRRQTVRSIATLRRPAAENSALPQPPPEDENPAAVNHALPSPPLEDDNPPAAKKRRLQASARGISTAEDAVVNAHAAASTTPLAAMAGSTGSAELCAYEVLRERNIERNNARLRALKLISVQAERESNASAWKTKLLPQPANSRKRKAFKKQQRSHVANPLAYEMSN